jgi:hypothetical protein
MFDHRGRKISQTQGINLSRRDHLSQSRKPVIPIYRTHMSINASIDISRMTAVLRSRMPYGNGTQAELFKGLIL